MTTIEKSFTDTQKNHFAELKKIVKMTHEFAHKWSKALLEIKVCEYWILDGSKSWKDWCNEHCPWAYRTIERVISEEVKNLPGATSGEEVIRNPKKTTYESLPTARDAQPVIDVAYDDKSSSSTAPIKPVVECDAVGYPIPSGHAIETWHRKQEAQDILTQLERVKSAINKAHKERDMFYLSEMEYQYTIARLDQLHYEFTKSKPYAVCLFCGGKGEKCEECNGRGMVSSIYWSREQHPDLPKYREKRLREIERLTQKEKQ